MSKQLLKQFKSELSFFGRMIRFFLFQDALMRAVVKKGAANAAKVVSITPDLLVAVQSTDFDDVVFLKFDVSLVSKHDLTLGEYLITSSSFTPAYEIGIVAKDLLEGPGSTRNFENFHPLVLQFLCDDKDRIQRAMDTLPSWEWGRLEELIDEVPSSRMEFPRNGNPYLSGAENPMAADAVNQLRNIRNKLAEPTNLSSQQYAKSEGAARRSRRKRR